MQEGLSQVTHGLWKVKEEGKGRREKVGELSNVLDSLACKVSAEPESIFPTLL